MTPSLAIDKTGPGRNRPFQGQTPMPTVDANVKASLRSQKKTGRKSDFDKMRKWFPDRVTIVAEGDSWFAYPPNWYLAGPPSNLIDHISSWTRRKANFYSPTSSGDEAIQMLSGRQKHHIIDVLRWQPSRDNVNPVDVMLFSGGGNDIVGENDFERFLKPCQSGDTAKQYVHLTRLRRKARQIELAYHELIDIRDHYSKNTLIVTHTYDYPYPSTQGGEFLGGLISIESWMKPYMDDINIPEELQCDVIRIFMDTLAEGLLKVQRVRSGFVVVDTRNTLKGKKEWLNEIHPTSKGFEDLARPIYNELVKRFPALG